MNNASVSRRGFLTSAAVATAGVAGLAAAGTNPTPAQALDQLTAETPDWLGTAPEVAETDITETLDTEVLICGFGTGGVPCAISAAQNGSKVLVIERDAQENMQGLREDLGALNTKLQIESFDEFPEFEISEKDAVEDIVRYANGYCDYNLIKLWGPKAR